MKIEGNQITFPKTLDVKYSGKLTEETDSQLTIEGEDDDSYLKVYSPFRGIAKLLLFENGHWVDAESGSADFDFSSLGMGNLPDFDNLGDLGDLGVGLPDLGGLDGDSGKEEIVEAEYVDLDTPNDATKEQVDPGKKTAKPSATKKKAKKVSSKKAESEETSSEKTPKPSAAKKKSKKASTKKADSNQKTSHKKTKENPMIVPNETLPTMSIETDKGTIELELYEDDAPNTVGNFISLIEQGFYDGLNFHRVIGDFMIQGGCPEGSGTGGPGYQFDDEISDRKHDDAGILSMANSGPRSNGSQFFITHSPTPHLDGKHTVFGKVTNGIDVVNAVEQGDLINKMVIQQKRDHAYEVQKL